MAFAVHIENAPRIKARLHQYMRQTGGDIPGADKIHDYLTDFVAETFRSEGSNIGETWPGYTGEERLYGLVKSMMIGDKVPGSSVDRMRLLRWAPGQERLMPSLTEQAHADHVWRAGDRKIVFGTSTPWAKSHQEGAGQGPEWAGKPAIKQRRFLKVTSEVAADIRRIMSEALGEARGTITQLSGGG